MPELKSFDEGYRIWIAEEKDQIRYELEQTLDSVNEQITQVKKLAKEMKCQPHKVKNYDGSFMMTPLLLAKSQVLFALHQIAQEDRKNLSGSQ